MGELTSQFLKKIQDVREAEEIEDWIWKAGDLIRRANSSGYHSGFEEIDSECVSEAEKNALQEAVLKALARTTNPSWDQSFLSVLRCAGDVDMKSLWIEYLARYLTLLKQSNGIVFTALLALKELDEPIFEGAKSLAAIDVERNVNEANEYLRRHNILIPG